MLAPDSRSLLVDALRPPTGARLSRALALTFTLDLESLLVAPLAFAAHGIRETSDPIAVMEGVRHYTERIDVFCQAGQITVPARNSGLLAFVEPMVHQVHRPKPGRLFHPKLWALRFHEETTGSVTARLLVLSRNLTNDHSWDICLRLDGSVGRQPHVYNRPLFELIQHTLRLVTQPLVPERDAAVRSLAEDLRRVEWELPEGVREMRFLPLGVPGAVAPDFAGTRHLIISPFCTPGGLRRCAPGQQATVVGRQEELDRLPDGTLDGRDVLVVSELAGLASEEAAAEGGDILTGLHAKVYVVEKGQTARMMLGSANATDAAFAGNVELLVELTGSRAQLGVDTMIGPAAAFRGILESYEPGIPVDPDADALALRDLIRDIATVPLLASVTGDKDNYDLRLTSKDALPGADDVRVTAQLHTRRGEVAQLKPDAPVDAVFGGLTLVEITPFVVVTAEDQAGNRERTVMLAQLVGDPADRLDHVIAHQVDTPEKFLRFLMLMLGLGADATSTATAAGGSHGLWATSRTGILELLLNALVDRPQQLDDLARLVARMESSEPGRQLLPPGFADLWKILDEARRTIAEPVTA